LLEVERDNVVTARSGKGVLRARNCLPRSARSPAALAEELPLRYARREGYASPLDALTDRELQVLKRLAEGAKCREIAKELHLSIKTIDTYRAKVLDKLNLQTTADLVRFAFHHGVTTDTW